MAFEFSSPLPVPASVPSHDVARHQHLLPVIGRHAVMICLTIWSIFPIAWMVLTSFMPADAIIAGRAPGSALSGENYAYVAHAIPMARMMIDTLIMATAITVAQTLTAILAAYGFAMFSFPGKRWLYFLFVGSWLVPFQVTMIPNYVLIAQMGLLNTVAGIVVPNLCSAFAVLMLRQHFSGFPKALMDAATMDGRSSWNALWTVLLPNMKPALTSLAVILFITAWNDYLWPTLIMQQSDYALMQVGVRSFLGAEGNNWGAVMAASGIACLPVFALYVTLQRHVVDGFLRSGLK